MFNEKTSNFKGRINNCIISRPSESLISDVHFVYFHGLKCCHNHYIVIEIVQYKYVPFETDITQGLHC